MKRKRVAIGIVAVASVVAVAGGSFGPLVRSKVQDAADKVGADVTVDWVVPSLSGVRLKGVHVAHPDARSTDAAFDEIVVSWGSPRTVRLVGGSVHVRGEIDSVLADVERLRDRLPKSRGADAGQGSTHFELEGLQMTYEGSLGKGEARGVRFDRGAGALTVSCEAASWEGSSVVATSGSIVAALSKEGEGYRLSKLETQALSVSAKLGSGGEPAREDSKAPSASKDESAFRDRLVGLRARVFQGKRAFESFALPEASIVLHQTSLERTDGSERLGIGPAEFQLTRHGEVLEFEFRAGEAPTGLSVKTRLKSEDDPLAVELAGGPISLSTLGLREGDAGLVDVAESALHARATFEVDPGVEVVSMTGDARVEDLSFSAPRVSSEPLRHLRAGFRGHVRGALDGSKLTVTKGELEVGTVRLLGDLDLSRYEVPKGAERAAKGAPAKASPEKDASAPSFEYKLETSFEVPLAPCQALLDSAPAGMLPTLNGMKLAGSFAMKGSGRVDTAKIDKTYDAKWDLSSTCRVTSVPSDVDVARFRAPWKRLVYRAGGERTLEQETGPGSAHWTHYPRISHFMEAGVIGFEDGRFPYHDGFDQEAIRNSIRENIRLRKFVRGASTISMQLAKNLYLSRDKLLARKLEELFLTMYLEQSLTKEQIMELYLNVVEFGPNVYGIDAAAEHYFRTSPGELSLSQAFYLASILPSPKKEHFGAGGQVNGSWLRLMRTVMKHARKRGRISEDELLRGLAEIPIRGSSSPARDPSAEVLPEDDGASAEHRNFDDGSFAP